MFLETRVRAINGEVLIRPLGDFHNGSREFTERSKKLLKQDINWVLERDNAFSILMGDLCNCSTKDSPGKPFEEESGATEQLFEILDLLEPLAKEKKILGTLIGNHEYQIMKATGSRLNRTAEIARALKVPYLGADALINLKVEYEVKTNAKRTYTIYAIHGYGGGRKRGSKVNNLAEMEHLANADLYIIGHIHDVLHFKKLVPEVVKGKPCLSVRAFTSSGSYLDIHDGFDMPNEGYGIRKGYEPNIIGSPVITLNCAKDKPKDVVITF